jgi:hypothetical protein
MREQQTQATGNVADPQPQAVGGGTVQQSDRLTSLIDHVLGYADRPWRALFVLALIVICGGGLFAYTERAELLHLLHGSAPVQLRADLGPPVDELLRQTTADMVAIYSIDLGSDTAEYRIGRLRRGGPWTMEPRVLPAIHKGSDPEKVALILRGTPSCFGSATGTGLVSRELAKEGLQYVCLVPVPPSAREMLIGLVILAWHTPPGAEVAEAATRATERDTGNLVR